ncbi:unnamed protein product [Macrosiphum euphorbiae]|uniref:Uncharacterized protein n=1 Tax=Macrosiphum euphorbiae TaxID=13131 RepID=A0AAV0VV28_9HEMI|nr:unnamed protein product [Macrosiphum euphorbiae]
MCYWYLMGYQKPPSERAGSSTDVRRGFEIRRVLADKIAPPRNHLAFQKIYFADYGPAPGKHQRRPQGATTAGTGLAQKTDPYIYISE